MADYQYTLDPNEVESVSPVVDPNEVNVGFTDYIGAAWRDSWAHTVMGSGDKSRELFETMVDTSSIDTLDSESIAIDTSGISWNKPMTEEEQLQYFKDNKMEGVKPYIVKDKDGNVTHGYTRESLDAIRRAREEEKTDAYIREQAPGWMTPFGVTAMIGASLADVQGMMMTLGTPVLSNARMLKMLQVAESGAGRAGVRALQGAISGAVGTALIEPAIVANRANMEFEWKPVESLLNIGMGAILGAGMHSGFGAWGEHVRNARGERHPWEILIPDSESEGLRTTLARELREMGEKVGAKGAEPIANAISGQFDVIARTIAFDTKKPLAEVYQSMRPVVEWTKTATEDGILNMARANAGDIAGVVKGVTGATDKELAEAVKLASAELAKKPEVVIDEMGRASIQLFRHTNFDDAQRAFFKAYKGMAEFISKMDGASDSAKRAFADMERFVGARHGEAWTAEQLDKFAEAGVAFFKNRNAVPEGMEGAFRRMEQFMREAKFQAENTGLHVPTHIDERVDGLQAPIEERDNAFTREVHDMANDTDIVGGKPPEDLPEPVTMDDTVRMQQELAGVEKDIERADLISEEIRESLRANGIDEEIIQGLDEGSNLQSSMLAESQIADSRAKALNRLTNEASEQEATDALWCLVEQGITQGVI